MCFFVFFFSLWTEENTEKVGITTIKLNFSFSFSLSFSLPPVQKNNINKNNKAKCHPFQTHLGDTLAVYWTFPQVASSRVGVQRSANSCRMSWMSAECPLTKQPGIVTFSQFNSCIFNVALTGWEADSSRDGLEKKKERKLFPPLIHWVYSWGRRSRGAPLSKIFHASSFICGCSSCPVSGTVTPEHSAATKHLAPSPTVQMKNKHNLPFWVSSKWGISWQIEGWFIMQRERQKRETLR